MIEQGQIDGVITTGLNFGAMYNPAAIIDDGYQFDQFHGGILDICFLGFAQVDREGNVNSSRFGNILTGCGGFIDISQHTRKVVFCGAFAAKADIEVLENGLNIRNPGTHKKFLQQVEQITFNGKQGRLKEQTVLYVTERAVFELTAQGVVLKEIAPGIDPEKDVLAFMEFAPIIADDLKTMPVSIFRKDFELKMTREPWQIELKQA
jgi:propionate CoA-transferase